VGKNHNDKRVEGDGMKAYKTEFNNPYKLTHNPALLLRLLREGKHIIIFAIKRLFMESRAEYNQMFVQYSPTISRYLVHFNDDSHSAVLFEEDKFLTFCDKYNARFINPEDYMRKDERILGGK